MQISKKENDADLTEQDFPEKYQNRNLRRKFLTTLPKELVVETNHLRNQIQTLDYKETIGNSHLLKREES